MGALAALRQPQFSEDIAWLPVWLQPHQDPLFSEHTKANQTPPEQACKDPTFPHRSCNGKEDVNVFTGEDARYNSCRLFLSGSDSSPNGFTPSGNVLHFHLHLSSNGIISQYTPNPACDIFPWDDSNGIPSLQPPAKTSIERMEAKDLDGQQDSKSSDLDSRFQSLTKDSKKHQEKIGGKKLVTADIGDVVDLSIAASEALLISEIVKTESASNDFPASAVLEIALRLKQARNNWCSTGQGNVSDCKADQLDEIDLLEDLDNDIMSDAYDDVGLSFSPTVASLDDIRGPGSVIMQRCSFPESVSRIPDTPSSENHYGCNIEVQNVNLKDQEVKTNIISSQRTFQDPLQEKLTGDPHLISNTLSGERNFEPYLNLSVQANSKVTISQGVDTSTVEGSPCTQEHTLESIVFSQVQESGNHGAENEVAHVMSDRFRSRWLGGWTGKDVELVVEMDQNNCKSVRTFVVRETSFISESAELFSDQNSFVNKLERRNPLSSLSSVACQGVLCNTPDKEIMPSQDLVTSSNISLADPLCSVIPCSISLDDANVAEATNNKVTIETRNYLHLPLENELENWNVRTTRLGDESGYEEENIFKNSESSRATSRKQLTSLQSYSMILPPRNIHAERTSCQNGSLLTTDIMKLLSSDGAIKHFESSSRKEGTKLMFSEPSECFAGKYDEKHQNMFAVEIPVTKRMSHKEHSNKSAIDETELPLQNQESECSPFVLNYGRRRRFQAPKTVLSNAMGDGNSVRASIAEMNATSYVEQSMMIPIPALHSGQDPNPSEEQVPSKKRVRFAETVVNNFHHSKIRQKRQSVLRARSNTKAGKRLKTSKLQANMRSVEDSTHIKRLPVKDGKRMIFQGLKFFLTGFTNQQERELGVLIMKHGGFLVSDVPLSPNSGQYRRCRSKFLQLPIFLSPKKLQTIEFLYGCAINAFLLKVNWLTDSIGAGYLLPPDNYMILPNRDDAVHQRIGGAVVYNTCTYIFDRVGIMFHGKHSYCTKLGRIVKHGGGQVFKTLEWLVLSMDNGKISVGVVVAENEGRVSRQLRQCAVEQKLHLMPVSWIIESLYSGKLLPFKDCPPNPGLKMKISNLIAAEELSPEI